VNPAASEGRVARVAGAATRREPSTRIVAVPPADPFAEQAEVVRLDPLTTLVWDALTTPLPPSVLTARVRAALPDGVELDDATIEAATELLAERRLVTRTGGAGA
jgi:hypothetical protein